MPTVLGDSHTHLDQYAPEEVPIILQRAKDVGVAVVIAAGVTEDSSARCIDLAERYPMVYAGVGIHPMEVRAPVDESMYSRLLALASGSNKVVCISEIGLDFIEGAPDLALQEQALRQQVRLAIELDLPIMFHSRESPGRLEAHHETLRVLHEEHAGAVGVVMHYFQADEGVARACLDLGFSISLAKPLLRLPHLQEVVKRVPLDRVVLETDAYPQPFKRNRARWTEPKDLQEIAGKVAELKGITRDDVAEVTTSNLLRILKGRVSLLQP